MCYKTWLLLTIAFLAVEAVEWHQKKFHHVPYTVTDEELRYVAGLSNEALFNTTLDPILIPRIPSTKGHEVVKKYIISFMKSLQWNVKLDSFADQTPLGELRFTNIIATLNPKASRHLVLACHYDSKRDREQVMILATDSAVPCAMMLNLAQLLNDPLKVAMQKNDDLTLQLIFFDGEEAFVQWSDNDSLYGARHLAKTLASSKYPAGNTVGTTHLHRMDVMVLLDLLGYRDPTFYSFFADTDQLFSRLVTIETRLHELHLLKNHTNAYFIHQLTYAGIEDDHIPFLRRGVRILHVIPSPFPPVWHRETDNKDNLDFSTIGNLNKIFRSFVVEYMKLSVINSTL